MQRALQRMIFYGSYPTTFPTTSSQPRITVRHRARPAFEPPLLQTIVAIAGEDEAIWFGKVTRVLSASVQVQWYEETGNKG